MRGQEPKGLAVFALLSAIALLAMGVSAQGAGPSPTSSAMAPSARLGCGPAGAEVLAQAAGGVAKRIYAGELRGTETRSDQRQVERYAPLLSAVASGQATAVRAAVHTLVYSHTHIVRLRITKGSTVMADEGGPYIIAPVAGSLRLRGRTIAHYALSVQDDLGYVKLVTRFLGVPLLMRVGARQLPIEGLLAPGPPSVPAHGSITYRQLVYEAYSFNARSFPGGPLRISLLVPVPASLSAKPCAQIKSAELTHAAQLISRRFTLAPSSFATYVKLAQTLTGGLLYIRSGSHQLAGSTRSALSLPNRGTVSYRGADYEVSSFLAPSSVGRVRVYQLVLP